MKLSEMKKNETNHSSNKVSATENKNIKETYEELKDFSSDELMSRLVKEVQAQKNSGVFDYDALRASIEKIKIYLPTETYENMIRIIESLK